MDLIGQSEPGLRQRGPAFIGGAAISAGDTTAGSFCLGVATARTKVKFVDLDQPFVSSSLEWSVYEDAGGTPGQVLASGAAIPTKALLEVRFGSFSYYHNVFSLPGSPLAAGFYVPGPE